MLPAEHTVPSRVEGSDLRYPIGQLVPRSSYSNESRAADLEAIAETPANINAAVHALTDRQLDTPYRPAGWTVRQVTHHLADSHIVLYVRLRQALTEDGSTVKTWDEVKWAELPDARTMPIEASLAIIAAVHARAVRLVHTLTQEQLACTMMHPDQGEVSIDKLLERWAWHGRHHTAHVTELRRRSGW